MFKSEASMVNVNEYNGVTFLRSNRATVEFDKFYNTEFFCKNKTHLKSMEV